MYMPYVKDNINTDGEPPQREGNAPAVVPSATVEASSAKQETSVGPVRINGKLPPEVPFGHKLLCLGCGNSAGFFTSLVPKGTETLVLTEHPTGTNKITSLWGEGDFPFDQTKDLARVKEYIRSSDTPVAIAVTTDPAKGKQWLDVLLKEGVFAGLPRDKVMFLLPQVPNPYLPYYSELGFPVVQLDYYPGIGGMRHTPTSIAARRLQAVGGHIFPQGNSTWVNKMTCGYKKTEPSKEYNSDGTTWNEVRVKQTTNVAIVASFEQSQEHVQKVLNVVRHLCANQEIKLIDSITKIELLPTNALLHTCGMIAHIAQVLVDQGLADESLLKAKTSEEFFTLFYKALDKDPTREKALIMKALTGTLVGKGFYREMPAVGPDVLMTELSSLVTKMRRELIISGKLQPSWLDNPGKKCDYTNAHILNHLPGKYEEQFKSEIGKDPHSVPFSDFIRLNPAYQNKGIVFPTKDPRKNVLTFPVTEGKVPNVEHRFFTEEQPTMENLCLLGADLGLSKRELEPFRAVINVMDLVTQMFKERGLKAQVHL